MNPVAGDFRARRSRPRARRSRPRPGNSRHRTRRPDATADTLRQPRSLSPVAAILPRDGELAAAWRELTAGATGLPVLIAEVGAGSPLMVIAANDFAEAFAALVAHGPNVALARIGAAIARPTVRTTAPSITPSILSTSGSSMLH